MIGGLAVLAITVLSILAGHTEAFGESIASYQWPILLGTVLVNTLVFTFFFRFAAARRHGLRSAFPAPSPSRCCGWHSSTPLAYCRPSHRTATTNAPGSALRRLCLRAAATRKNRVNTRVFTTTVPSRIGHW